MKYESKNTITVAEIKRSGFTALDAALQRVAMEIGELMVKHAQMVERVKSSRL